MKFIKSLVAFLRLYRAGFAISHSKGMCEIYRFYWNDKAINAFPDIDCVDGHYNTMQNGRSERLGARD